MKTFLRVLGFVFAAVLLTAMPRAAEAQPAFSKSFSPNSIGVGSVSTLTFTIDNSAIGTPTTDLDFADTLPATVFIAPAANIVSTCTLGVVTAPPGTSVISYTDGSVGAAEVCTISVDVIANTAGTHTNTTGDLTSSAGNSGTATADLTATIDRPGFSLSFSPSSIPLNGRSTATYTIDGTTVANSAVNLSFTHTLPVGAEVANPSNIASTCNALSTPVLTATPGGSSVAMTTGSFASGSVCTVTVDVTGISTGQFDTQTGELSGTFPFFFLSAGRAAATLEVTGAGPDSLQLSKSFTDDPVAAGDTVNLEFRLQNTSRSSSATNVAFTDDLNATLAGLAATGLPSSVCGGTLSGTSLLSLTGATLSPGEICTFSVTLQVPVAAATGSFPNTTSTVTGLIGGSPVTGPAASDSLVVSGAPTLTKTFLTPSIVSGDSVVMELTLTNPSAVLAVTGITFEDNLDSFLPGTTVTALPAAGSCGAGSNFFTFVNNGSLIFSMLNGNLVGGASCTFQVTLQTPAGAPGGVFTNTTSAVSSSNGASPAASAALTVNAGQTIDFSKAFDAAEVDAGDTVDLTFTLDFSEGTQTLTNVSFTDDLDAMLTGATIVTIPAGIVCGDGTLSGVSTLTLTGATLSPGEVCVFSVEVKTPADADTGLVTNTTSDLTATASGTPITVAPATAGLQVQGADDQPIEFSMQYLNGPFLPGQVATLEYTLTNPNQTQAATAGVFTHSLSTTLSGLVTTGALPTNPCGLGSSVSGTNFVIAIGLILAPGATCTFTIDVLIPPGAADGQFTDVTGSVSATINSAAVVGDPANTTLEVSTGQLIFSKSFTDDPVVAGTNATLEFTIENPTSLTITSLDFSDDLDAMLSGAQAISGLVNGCGGMAGFPFSTFNYSNGTLAPGGTCTIRISVSVPAAATPGNYVNTTSGLTASASGLAISGDPASDTLTVLGADAPTFSKAFGAANVNVGDTVDLTFTLTNTSATDTITNLQFTDNLDDFLVGTQATGLPASTCGGTISGTGFLQFTGGSLAPSASCDITVTLQIPNTASGGNFVNTTSQLFQNGTAVAPPATASITVVEVADLRATLAAVPGAVFPNSVVNFPVNVFNDGPNDVTDAVSTFTLPAGLTLLSTTGCPEDPTGVPTCTLGSISSGGSAVYLVSATVDASTTGFVSAQVDVSSSTSDPNASNNTVNAGPTVFPLADISVTKDDGVTSVRAGETVTYTIQVANAGPSADPAVSLTDTFPADLENCSYTSVASGGATGNSASGSGDLSDTLNMPTGGQVTYTATCTVAASASGTLSNTASATASVDDSNTGNNSATDNNTTVIVPSLDFTKAFASATVDQGETDVLTFTIDNSANALPANSMAFTDNFPVGLEVAATPAVNNTCGGTFTANAGATSVSLSGGTLPAGGTCTIDVSVRAVGGSVTNTSGDLTSTLPTASGATDTLTVIPASPPAFTKVFGPDTIDQGEESTLTFTIDNSANAIEADSLSFTDSFPAGLEVAAAPAATNTCGGTFTANAGDTSVDLTGGNVSEGLTCTISVRVLSTASGGLVNTSGDLTSTIATASGATDTLTVNPLVAPGFSKAFASATVDQGETDVLTFTIDNAANAIDGTGLAFTDNLPLGMIVADTPAVSNACGGTFTANAGASSVSLTGGTVTARSDCTISVTIRAVSPGGLVNTSGDLTSTLPTASGANDTLTVNPAAAPGFAKVFAPDTIDQGEESTLTFTIDNSANAIEADSLSFTDSFPAGLEVAAAPAATNTCGGTFTANAGDTSVDLTGGNVSEGLTCTISVRVLSTASGGLVNTSGDLTSTIATASGATDTLTVNPLVAPGFSKAFASATVDQGETDVLTFTIDNAANAIDGTGLAFTDNLPLGMIVADTPAVSNACGGTFTANAGASSVSLTGGTVTARSDCTISVTIRAVSPGGLVNTSGDLTSTLPTASGANDTLTVNPAAAPGFAKVFAPDTIDQGEESTLTFTIDNSANAIEADSLSFTDSFPAGLEVAAAPAATNTCGGTFTANAGDTSVDLTGGNVSEGLTCTISVRVLSTASGGLVNTSGDLTSTIATASGATDTLTVNPLVAPGFTKAFASATVDQGETDVLTFTIDNSANALPANSMAFTDNFPVGLEVAATPSVNNTCGGTFTANAGASSVSLTGGIVTARSDCTISVTIRAVSPGGLVNTSGDLTSTLPTASGANDTLTVNPAAAPGFAKSFSPTAISQGATTRMRFDIDNTGNSIEATNVAFTDAFPAGMEVSSAPTISNTCGGTFTANAGDTSVSLTGGTLAALGSCVIEVNVTATTVGVNTNTAGDLTSTLPTAAGPSADLTVNLAGAPNFMKSFTPDAILQGQTTIMRFDIDNSANFVAADNLAFTDRFPGGLQVADTPLVDGDCGGTFTANAGDTGLTFTGGSVAAGAQCFISVQVTAISSGTLTNTTSDLTSTATTALPAMAELTVTAAGAPGFEKLFVNNLIDEGQLTTLRFTIDNAANAIGTSALAFTDDFPAGLKVADTPAVENTCGGTFTANAGDTSINLVNGAVAANGTCTIEVDVLATATGTLTNTTSELTSTIATASEATDDLVVTPAAAPGFTKVFNPDQIAQGAETTLTFTIDNAANSILAGNLAFTDDFPAGLLVADAPAVANDCGGTFTANAGDTSIGLADGEVAAGATCDITVTVRAIGSGTLTNTTSELTSTIATASEATDDLVVTPAAAPGFTKVFNPDQIAQGAETTLTFTIDNAANSILAGNLAFTDDFPAGLLVADAPAVANDCGGTFTANAGDTSIGLADGEVAAGATCDITVTVRAIGSGTLTNTTSELTSTIATASEATDDLVVTPAAAPGFTKVFNPDQIAQGAETTLTFTIDNAANSILAGNLAFTDDFPAGLLVADAPAVANDCGGTFTANAGDTSIGLADGEVAAGATCDITVTVRAIGSGTLTNTTSELTSTIATASEATDDLVVTPAAAPGFTKVFNPDQIAQGAETTLTFTIDNAANSILAGNLAFTDDFPAGLLVADAPAVANDCGGTFTANAGDTSIGLADGEVAAGATCDITVTVRAIGSGTLTNTTSELTSTIATASEATDDLVVTPAAAPGFTKVFNPDQIAQGAETTLTFTIDNAANSILAGNLAFTDDFPAGLLVADAPAVANDCGGTFTANAGDTSIGLADGEVAAGATCDITVTVRAIGSGTLTNTTSELTSTIATASEATDDLVVTPAAAPGFTKVFNPDQIAQGAETTLTFTIDNAANSILAGNLAFTDDFPAGLLVADAPAVANDCGGTFTANAGDTSIGLADGEVAAGATCDITVTVRAIGSGTLTNTTSELTSTIATASEATDDLVVTPAAAPGFTKVFNPDQIAQGAETTLTFTIDNAANSILAGNLAFTDDFPAGLLVADAPAVANDCGGTFTANAGDTSIGLADGEVAAGATCDITVTVRAIGSGTLTNTTSELTSTLPSADAASDELTVASATMEFSKRFDPATIAQGETTVLSFVIDNTGNAIEATDLAFTDDFPAGLQVAAAPSVSNSCGGTFNAAAGATSISLSDGNLAADATCTIEVTVQALRSGRKVNRTSRLTSSLETVARARAVLRVTENPLDLDLSFSPSTIEQNQTSTMTLVLTNNAEIDAANIRFGDTLPAGLVVPRQASLTNTCGGTIRRQQNGKRLTLRSGTLVAGGRCTITAPVTAAEVGAFPNAVENLRSSLGQSATADGTLVVEAATTGTLTIVQNTDTDGAYVFSSTEALLNFNINAVGGTGTSGPITLVAGAYTITQTPPAGVGNTAITCNDDDSSGNAVGKTLTVNVDPLEAVVCTITSISSQQKTVDTINRFLTKRTDLILSNQPALGRRGIDRLNRGFGNSSVARFANGDIKALLPFSAQVNVDSENYRFSTSLSQMRRAATTSQLAFSHEGTKLRVDNTRWDAWFEAQYQKFNSGSESGHFAVAHFGVDYLVSPNLLVGAMLQIDDLEDDSALLNTSASGTGWMFGPYMTARLAPNLYFDGRITAGQSTNKISPFNTYQDEFDTDRWLVMAGLTGDLQMGKWSVQPGASLAYIEETQHAYIDGVGVLIPSQTVSLGQLKLGPTFSGHFETARGTSYSPYLSIDTIFNFGSTTGVVVTNPNTPSNDGWRGRIQTGVDFTLKGGTRLSLGGSYDGIGRGDFEAWGLNFELSIPLQ